jgi:hypothetical protein
MSKLKAATRRAMPKSEFAGPGKSFPINDKTHARLAIPMATRSERAGNISAGTADKIKAKARAKLDGAPDAGKTERRGGVRHPASHEAFEALGRD